MSRIIRIVFILILILPGLGLLAQTADDQIYEFIAVQDKPVIRNDVQPDYPQSAIDAGVEGTVVVTVVIDQNGNVSDAEIFSSVAQLDNAALSAARRKTFSPGAIDGSPVITRMNIPIVFSLADVQDRRIPETTETETYTPSTSGDVVDLTADAVIIKAEPDRPRVNIISDRIKPEFDNINLEKSFVPELLGRAERIVIVPQSEKDKSETIDINQILNRSR
jgi:TonB family protein